MLLPDAFRRLLGWMEASGFVRTYRARPDRFAGLHPAVMADEVTSSVAVESVDPVHLRHWTGIADRAVTDRIAPFIRTGGDGSYAALWRDEEGATRFVHLGSGSGCDWVGVIADDPVDVRRLLAVSYDEPAFPSCLARTREAVAADEGLPFVPPASFRAWVTGTFGVTTPARGSEVVRRVTWMDDRGTGDPFLDWLEAARRATAEPGTCCPPPRVGVFHTA